MGEVGNNTEGKDFFHYFVSDTEIYKNKNVYLYFEKKAEILRHIIFMLDYFYGLHCKVHGLAGKNQDDAGIRVFNKKVVHYSTLSKEKDVVIKWGKKRICGDDLEYPFFNEKDEELKRKQIIVWGTGEYAADFCNVADQYGWRISFFVDSNWNKCKKYFRNKKIFPVDRLKMLPDDSIVIEAAYQWREMEESAEEICPDIERFHFKKLSVLNLKADLGIVYAAYAILGDHKICIYGEEKKARSFYDFYSYFDFHVECRGGGSRCHGTEIELKEETIKEILELSQAGNYILLARGKSLSDIECLEKVGLKYCVDFAFADQLEVFRYMTREFIYDINLGYSYQKECKYPGIAVYGDEEHAKYRIVCLGNSTTDSYLLPYKSWPEFLKQAVGDDVCIYNAGCEGYNTVQDFLKLMRDMLEFEPDIVLEVSGMNETWCNEKFPFYFNYMEVLYHKAAEGSIYKGIPHTKPFWKQWLDNIEAMHAICELHQIEYHAFLQPMLAGKSNKDHEEESRLLSYFNIISPKRLEKQRSFGSIIDQIKKEDDENRYFYIHNLTNIFDTENYVYLDECHLNERGNYILAEKIRKYIKLEK